MIRDRGIAHRYAQALFGAALKENQLESVLADLLSLEELYQRDPSFQNMLDAPYMLTEVKVELIHRILDGRASDLVIRFLLLMLAKKRVQHLPLVFERYRELVEEHLGMERAQVRTAVPLAGDLAEELRGRLEALTGKKIRLEPRVDPAVVGGIVVTLGGKVIDGSIRHRLEELREQLLSARVLA